MRWSFKTALTLNFVLLASLPILFVGLFTIKYLSKSMEQEIADKNLLLAQSYARELDRFLGDSFRRQQHLANLLEKKPITLEGKLKNYFTTEVSGEDDLEMVRVLDKEGVVVYLTPFDQNILGLDMSRQDYCLAAKERQAPYWSNVFISPQTGRTTIALAIPYDQGMVVGHLSLSAVHEVIDSLNLVPGGYVAVLDRDGTAIAHFNHALVEQRANLSNHAHIAEGLSGQEGTFRYSMNDQSHIGSVAVVARTKWVVTVSQPLAEIFLPIRNFIRILYAGIFIAVLMAVVVAVISIQRILSPLRRLTHDANRIAAGNYALAPVTTSYVEIAELSDSLKKMIDEVGSREKSLRDSEARFRVTFEQAAVGIAHVAPEGSFIRINQKFCNIVGYSNAEMKNQSFQDITHPDDLEADMFFVRQLLAGTKANYSIEKRYIRKDGGTIWVNLTVSMVHDEKGNPSYFVSVVEDITQRKKLREERDRILTLSPDLICIAGMDGYLKYVNPAFENTLGYSKDELLAKPFLDFTHPNDRKRNVAEVERLAAGHATIDFENRHIHKDGSIHHVLWVATPLVDEKLMYCIGRDITERKKAELKLRLSEERYRALFEQSHNGILFADVKTQKFKYANPAIVNLLGYSREELCTLGIEDIHPADSLEWIKEEFNVQLLTKNYLAKALPCLRKDGSIILVDITATPLATSEGTFSIGFFSDVTDRVKAEEKIKEYQVRLRALASQLTLLEEKERRRIANDLHDQIGQSLAFSRIQVAKAQKYASGNELKSILAHLSESLLVVIRDVKEVIFSLSSPVLNELGLAAAITNWLEENVQKKHGIQVEFIGDDLQNILSADLKAILFRNVRELLANVVKHANAQKVVVSMYKRGAELVIAVRDDGVGLDLTTELATSRLESGFGLFSIKERLEDFGGSLQIESEPGMGMKTTMTVPLWSADD